MEKEEAAVLNLQGWKPSTADMDELIIKIMEADIDRLDNDCDFLIDVSMRSGDFICLVRNSSQMVSKASDGNEIWYYDADMEDLDNIRLFFGNEDQVILNIKSILAQIPASS